MDISLAKKIIKFNPRTSLYEGLKNPRMVQKK